MTEPDRSCAGCGQWLPDGEAWDISQGDGFLCRSCAKPNEQRAGGDQQRAMPRLVNGESYPRGDESHAAAETRAVDQPVRPPTSRWISMQGMPPPAWHDEVPRG